jgi:hypothetical protein
MQAYEPLAVNSASFSAQPDFHASLASRQKFDVAALLENEQVQYFLHH